MNVERFCFTGHADTLLPATVWVPDGELKAVLQITHGMTEHVERFAQLAEELTQQGIAVAGFDLRGHGRNAGDPDVASFGAEGWDATLQDMHLFFELLEGRFSGLPHVMLGFSLGSFLLREYLGKYPEKVNGAIIMGTGYQNRLLLSVMMKVVQGQVKKVGFDHTTDLIKKLSFGTYNQKLKPNRTEADWLCRDEKQLNIYLTDPLCRKNISAGLFWEMLSAMKRTGGKDAYIGWNKEMPVLLLSGKDDPVGSFGRGVQTVREQMKKSGLTCVTMQLMPYARHDVLHEEESGAGSLARSIIGSWITCNLQKSL